MAYTLNGIGTIFYGQRDFKLDHTFITTEWVVFCYIPLFPLRSFRVSDNGAGDFRGYFGLGSSRNYAMHGTATFPNWKQVISIYGYVAILVFWTIAIFSTFYKLLPHSLETTLGAVPIVIACLIPVPTPWILRYCAVRKLRHKMQIVPSDQNRR